MHYDPKCQANEHKCKEVCISAACNKPNPFVCNRCSNQHKDATCKIIEYKRLIVQLHKIQGTHTNELLKYEERVENTFNQLIGGLRRHFLIFREEIEFLNIHPKIQSIYMKIKSNRESSLTAAEISEALSMMPQKNCTYRVKDELAMRLLKKDIMDAYQELNLRLPPYYSLKKQLEEEPEKTERDNKIKMIEKYYMDKRKQVEGLFNPYFAQFEEMLGKPIYNVHLLYRASQSKFLAEEFHRKCDGISNTVTIAKTEYGNVIIGFSCFPWSSPKTWEYQVDSKGECFLMSPHEALRGRKFTPFKTKFAIGMHRDYGPSFGDDFVIYNKAEHSKNCWSNFPDVYTCKTRPVAHDQNSIKAFTGASDHFQKFNLVEWQVYKVSFGPEDEIEKESLKEYRKIPYKQS